jgi:hypothetical protein
MARMTKPGRDQIPPPVARTPPFLLAADADGAPILICPFRKRKSGPSREEMALVRSVAGRLERLPGGPVWIDPRDGSMTPAAIGADQVRRRLIDDASFTVRAGG